MKPRQNTAAGKPHTPNMPSSITVGNYIFERVDSFKYLGSTETHNNNISEEIRIRLMTANRTYFALIKILKSRLLSRKTKMQIYKTPMRPVLTYTSETWTLTKDDTHDGWI
jgi:sorting nexin-29